MGKNTKGSRRERELVNALVGEGWGVIRAPASGSRTDRELPDVLAGNGELVVAIEAKASKRDNPIYVEQREVEDLCWFAGQFGARPRIGVRFDYTSWAFFHPEDLHETDSGSRRVKHEDVVMATGRVRDGVTTLDGLGSELVHRID